MAEGFNLPIITNIPVEEAAELDIRAARDAAYIAAKEAKIKKRFMKPNSATRKVADYVSSHFTEIIDLDEMSNEIDVRPNVIKLIIADLNFWHEFGYKMKRAKGQKGCITSVKKDVNDTDDYLRKKSRCIATMEKVWGEIDDEIKPLKRAKKKQKIKNAEELVEKVKNET